MADAVEAEQLGFRRILVPERYNLKEAGAFLGGVGALTSRIGFGTGAMGVRSRHPLVAAGMAATMQAAYGPRFVLGLGRSLDLLLGKPGHASYQEMIDFSTILKQLWRGETVTYEGPAGKFDEISLGDVHPGPPPEIWITMLGGPLGSEAAANPAFDGVLLYNMMTPEATHLAVWRIHRACEKAGRDPSTIRICQPVVTAPDMDDYETRALAHARFLTYISQPREFMAIAMNGWDRDIAFGIRDQIFAMMQGQNADLAFHREQLIEQTRLVPDSWVRDSCATGSSRDCFEMLREYRRAGADEILTYGSSPGQNAGIVALWKEAASAV